MGIEENANPEPTPERIEEQRKRRKRLGKRKLDEDGLNRKQRRFAARYLVHQNAARAAREAGYKPRNATVIGSQLLAHANVSKVVAREQANFLSAASVTTERTLLELARIAYHDIRALYDDEGQLKPVTDLTADIAAAIAGVEQEDIFGSQDGKKVQTGRVRKVRMANKNQALEMLAKIQKMVEGAGAERQKDRLDEVVRAIQEPKE